MNIRIILVISQTVAILAFAGVGDIVNNDGQTVEFVGADGVSTLRMSVTNLPTGLYLGTTKVFAGDQGAIMSQPSFADDGGGDGGPVSNYCTALLEYRNDNITLTNKIANYNADYIVSTNKISLVADSATQTAMNKIMKSIDDLQAEKNSLRQMVADLKKMQKAQMELK